MSYINIWQADDSHISVDEDGEPIAIRMPLDLDHTKSRLTDGEEIHACVKILHLLDALDNGEALVITRDLF